ncbi:hypothetical protein ERJ75_001808900 [Trypanosoma vivax]|uniref:Leucine-rich repeat protein (LRRP) n=1 Tax=Trypanosoma vivax (strain Y486) TaxID=1055687 RepID=F9WLR8_TRYVY|nr:hypothetical protein ERJ75_001808900 [Trypanosoma vivax]CCD18462.1 hypothetical protein, conserved in T. vivax [Trypanosoma vivax Y486]|eukprot:CCD18462.1 hypothetical protein, conserved in T. vivax [Trypanosoma vivax Y486]
MSKRTASDTGVVDASDKDMSPTIDFSAISQWNGVQPPEKKKCADTKKGTKTEAAEGVSGINPGELRDVRELVVDGTPPADFSFSFLSGCNSLVKLKLKCRDSALDLQTLTGHKELEILEIQAAKITNFASLRHFPSLKQIKVACCSFYHDGVAYASRMDALEELELYFVTVFNKDDFHHEPDCRYEARREDTSDATPILCAYKGSPRLRKVLLAHVKIRDLSPLLDLEALEELELNDTVVPEGLGVLGRHAALRGLVCRIPLTQDCLCGLGESKSLVRLDLEFPFIVDVQYDVSPLGSILTLQDLRIRRPKLYGRSVQTDKPDRMILRGFDAIGKLPNLTELFVSDYKILGDTVSGLSASMTIKRLYLHPTCPEDYESSLSPAQLRKEHEKMASLLKLESLEELVVDESHCFDVGDGPGYLPNLRVIKLRGHMRIGGLLYSLGDSLTLRMLEIIGAEDTIDLLPIPGAKTLEEVKLHLLRSVKNSHALGYLPRLRKLEVIYVSRREVFPERTFCVRESPRYYMLDRQKIYDAASVARAKTLEDVSLCKFWRLDNLDALLELPHLREAKLSNVSDTHEDVAALTAKGVNVTASKNEGSSFSLNGFFSRVRFINSFIDAFTFLPLSGFSAPRRHHRYQLHTLSLRMQRL